MTRTLKFWQVDSFSRAPFEGNPAAVFVLQDPLDDALLQNIAIEMNLSETAFILLRAQGHPLLRWFTPTLEIDLCGHATLAAAHIYLTEIMPDLESVTFDTKFVGPLRVDRDGEGYRMDFPSRPGEELRVEDVPSFVLEGIGTDEMPIAAFKARDLMLVYAHEQSVRNARPDFNALAKYKDFIGITARSADKTYDFVSRFFCADDGITEDPVTGSFHCTATPYWGRQLGKQTLVAYQASKRGGELFLEIAGDRIFISGNAVSVIEGMMTI